LRERYSLSWNGFVFDFEIKKSFGTLTKFLSDVKQLPFFAVREGVKKATLVIY